MRRYAIPPVTLSGGDSPRVCLQWHGCAELSGSVGHGNPNDVDMA
jgi:hypothetical protein